MSKPQLVLIEWKDSLQPVSGWSMLDDLPSLRSANCRTVGWVVGEDRDTLMLAQNVADLGTDNPQGGGFMRIPKVCVTKRRRLA
jgi:hypothetical protein